jgi:hypothetical protein
VSITCSLAFLTQLRSLSLTLDAWVSNPKDFAAFILEALRQLTTPCLEKLDIFLPTVGCDRLDLDGWSELSSLIESLRFSSTLHTLTFRFWENTSKIPSVVTAREQWIMDRFPLCTARGIVQFGEDTDTWAEYLEADNLII